MDSKNENCHLDEPIGAILARQKYFFSCKVKKLYNLLQSIHPRKENYLFLDIVGRILWNATATAKTVENLINSNDYYGIKSVARKLLECKLQLDYLFGKEDRNKLIANILAQYYFELNNRTERDIKDVLIAQVSELINKYNENILILEYFQTAINGKRKHWSWTESGFNKLIKNSINSDFPSTIKEWLCNIHLDVLTAVPEPS